MTKFHKQSELTKGKAESLFLTRITQRLFTEKVAGIPERKVSFVAWKC